MRKVIVCLFLFVSFNLGQGNWNLPHNLLDTNTDIMSICINSDGDIFLGTLEGVFRSSDNGDTWIKINKGLTTLNIWSIAINQNGEIFAGTDDYLFYSQDDGENWIQEKNGLTELDVKTFDVRAIEFNSEGSIFIGTDTGGIYRSDDNGENWTQINNGLTSLDVSSLAANMNGDIFAGTLFGGGVFRSSDNGETWIQIIDGLSAENVWSLGIKDNGHIFAGTDNYIYRSRNNGDSWVLKNNGLTELNVETFDVRSIDFRSNGIIFIGTDTGGIYRSGDNGNNWTQVNNGLTALNVSAIAINSDGYIFAGTLFNGGVFRSTENGESWVQVNNGITDIDNEPILKYNFSLEQNYPNPFNPTTKIVYSIPITGNVSLKVFDILGTEITHLVNEKLSSGTYETQFDGGNLASGIYIYELSVNPLTVVALSNSKRITDPSHGIKSSFIETKKMILIK